LMKLHCAFTFFSAVLLLLNQGVTCSISDSITCNSTSNKAYTLQYAQSFDDSHFVSFSCLQNTDRVFSVLSTADLSAPDTKCLSNVQCTYSNTSFANCTRIGVHSNFSCTIIMTCLPHEGTYISAIDSCTVQNDTDSSSVIFNGTSCTKERFNDTCDSVVCSNGSFILCDEENCGCTVQLMGGPFTFSDILAPSTNIFYANLCERVITATVLASNSSVICLIDEGSVFCGNPQNVTGTFTLHYQCAIVCVNVTCCNSTSSVFCNNAGVRDCGNHLCLQDQLCCDARSLDSCCPNSASTCCSQESRVPCCGAAESCCELTSAVACCPGFDANCCNEDAQGSCCNGGEICCGSPSMADCCPNFTACCPPGSANACVPTGTAC